MLITTSKPFRSKCTSIFLELNLRKNLRKSPQKFEVLVDPKWFGYRNQHIWMSPIKSTTRNRLANPLQKYRNEIRLLNLTYFSKKNTFASIFLLKVTIFSKKIKISDVRTLNLFRLSIS